MSISSPMQAAGNARLPSAGQIFLDHVGHFVSDPHAASQALERAGFAPTPISLQVNPDPSGGAPKPTGTGNVCAMLDRGYLEVLFKTADTPLGRDLDTSTTRYEGLHLAAFAITDAPGSHARLISAGFRVQPVVDMRRPVETVDGEDIAAFAVVRLETGQMPEGRIQMLRHLTMGSVWQPRWLSHPNTAAGLKHLTIVVADVAEASDRFARFLGHSADYTPGSAKFVLDRGSLELASAGAFNARFPDLPIPSLPFMGACTIAVQSIDTAAAALVRGGLPHRIVRETGRPALIEAPFPPELGQGVWLFEQD